MADADHDNPTILVWTDPQRVPLITDVLEQLADDGVRVAAIGGPTRAGLAELARSLDVPLVDDGRQMRVEHPADYLLMATTEGLRRTEVQAARQTGMTVLMIEPPLADVGKDDATLWTPPPDNEPDGKAKNASNGNRQTEKAKSNPKTSDDDTVHPTAIVTTTPLMRMCPGWRAAMDAEALDAIGRLRTVNLSVLGPQEFGGVYARCFDAMDLLHRLLGMADSVEAALTGPLSEPPADLRGMTGHLTAHLRYASGAAAVLQTSDRAACFRRSATILGERGQLTVTDASFEFVARSESTGGSDTEATPAELIRADATLRTPADPAALIADHWRSIHNSSEPPVTNPLPPIIASCQAASLSSRTGGLESPATLLRLHGG